MDVALVPIAPGSITAAAASVSSELSDPDTSNNTASVTVRVWPRYRTKYVAVGDTTMTPSTVSLSLGWTVQWNFLGGGTHDVTDSTGLGLYASGSHAPGSYYQHTFDFAGGYTYTSTQDSPGFGGIVKVAPVVTPTRGTASMRYQLGLTTAGTAPPPGLAFDVQLQRPGTAYTSYLYGTTAQSLDFLPDAGNGTYRFRVQLRASDDAKSEYVSSDLVVDPDNPLQWVHQLGTSTGTAADAIAVDAAGNSYLTGTTYGTLPGSPETNAGNGDIFVAKYDTAGNRLWVRQLGTKNNDSGSGIAVDAAGNSYVTGTTYGRLPGSPERGFAFVAKYNTNGNRQWVHEFRLAAHAIAVDGAGNIYITGARESSVTNTFVAKYDTDGNHQWTRQISNADHSDIIGLAIAVDTAGNSYLTGQSGGWGHSDVFVAKYDTNGNRRWIQRFGSPFDDVGWAIAADGAGNSYLTGSTDGTMPGSPEPNAGIDTDAFVGKFDTNGNQQWIHEFGSRYDDWGGSGVAVDAAGNSSFTGSVDERLPGSPEQVAGVYVAQYDTNGNRQSVHQFGSDSQHPGIGIDAAGNSYISGSTGGTLPGSPETNAGSLNAFVAKYLHAA